MSNFPEFYNGGIIDPDFPFLYTNISKQKGGGAMANSDAQREATARFNKKRYERVELWVKKGNKALIQLAAQEAGKSINRFILDLAEEGSGLNGL